MYGKAPGALHHAHRRAAAAAALVVIQLAVHATAGSWEGLVAYWPLDEGSGLNAADITGKYNATFAEVNWTDTTGPATQFTNPWQINVRPWGTGKHAAFSAAGTAFEELDSAGQFTLACWIWPDNPQYYGILGHSGLRFLQHSNPNPGIGLELSTGYVNSATGRITTDTRFYHVAVTYDASSGTVRFYIDGADAGTASLPAPARIGSDNDFWIGGSNGYVGQGGKQDYSGLIDDVRIYSRVLSPEEIGSLAAGRGELPQWSNNCRVYLNTTSTGANVADSITDFPVLVRLTGADFTFSEALAGGADLRFAKAGGVVPLPYEIEHWDAGGQQAAVWVKVDTVYGSNSDQYFMMYWGQSGVADGSCAECVFDTANAFEAVWHLSESGSGATGEFKDATYNSNDGRGGKGDAGRVPARIAGPIGYCQDFDSTRPDDITVPGSPSNTFGGTAITLSAWANLRMACKQCGNAQPMRKIFGKGWMGWGLYHRNETNDSSYEFFCNYGGSTAGSAKSDPDFATFEWHHVTGTYDGAMYRIYVDGELAGSAPQTVSIEADNGELYIGNYNSGATNHTWHGWIDEPRLSRTVRSPAWIRLCYQNQRASQTLVSLQPFICEDVAITAHPRDTSVVRNTQATFRVVATGTGRRYQWYKNASPISGATSATYTYTAPLSDSGASFHCEVSGDCGAPQSSQPAILSVTTPCAAISIQSSPRDTSIVLGGSITFSVTVSGTSPQYQWQKDGIDISGQTASSYAIDPVDVSHAGSYRCVVRNACSQETTVPAVLTVCEPATITSQPRNAEVIVGGNALFQVSATGTNLLYQWERDTGSGWQSVAGATSATHTVESATLGQNGHVYHCLVTNGCGQATSNACTLTVNAACVAVSITAHPQDTTVVEKSLATLRVAVSGTNPTFQWYRGSTPLPTGTTNPFTFTAYRRDNGVSYTCEVSGDCGTPVVSNPAVLSVRDTTRPHPTTTLTLNAPGPNDINVRWSTPETDSTDGDSVFIYYSGAGYRQPASQDKNVLVADTVSTATGEREANLSGLTAETEYFFSVWLKDSVGNWAAADSGSVTTGSVGTPTNPVVVRGEYVSGARVRLSLSNICPLVSAENPFTLYADYVGVWYQSGDYVLTPDTNDSHLLRFPVADLQAEANCGGGGTQRDTVLSLPALSAPDSLYYFSVSVVWRNPDSVMAFTRANGDSVLMRDVSAPDNPCVVSGSYPGGRSDSAFVNVSNVGAIEPKVRDVVVYCSFDTTFADTFFAVTLPADSVMSGAVADTFRVKVRNAAFDGAVRTVYCAVVLVSDAGVPSPVRRGELSVGRELPRNPLELSALALSSYQVRLSWPSIAGVGADSIRIFVDTVQAPLGVVNVGKTIDTVFASPADTEVIVTDLSASELYHFTAQAKIGLDWTPVTNGCRAFATTDTAKSSDSIPNTAVVDTAYLDTARNRIVLVWQYDSLADSAQYGVVYGIDSAATAGRTPANWYNAVLPGDTAYIELGESILFDTTYTLFVRMRKLGGGIAPVTTDATFPLRMPHFTWQPISYFDQATADTAWAFNKHVALWYPGDWAFGEFIDTVRAVVLLEPPTGLRPVSTGIVFERGEDGPSLHIALRYDSVPTGFNASDIRLYRRSPEGLWHVYHDFSVIADRGLVVIDERLAVVAGQCLMLMIDTKPPTADVLSDIDTPVEPNTRLLDTVQVTDNVANVIATLLYARGENAASAASFDTLRGPSGQVTTVIPEGYVTADNGVRAYLVISDGLHVDTLNISRQVIVTQASDIMTTAEAWVPLRTTAVLDSGDMASVVNDVTDGLGYDNTLCRVFRWFDPDVTEDVSAGPHGWVEYSTAKSAIFDIEAGKLMWVKTRDAARLDFGSGVTTSLRDTITVSLPPENWTDLALPYKFRMYVGDIIDATGGHADSLAFYRWSRGSDNVYETEVLHVPSLPVDSLNDKATLLSPDTRSGYSIYNKMPVRITLRIPPTTHVMSSYHTSQRALSKVTDDRDEWAVTVNPRIRGGRRLGTVVLGYVPGDGERTWYPVSPSFGKVGVHVYDRRSGGVYGHAVEHRLDSGGARFDVRFSNETDQACEVLYTVGGLESIPDSMQVKLIDPAAGAVQHGGEPLSVVVPAKGRAVRVVSIGSAAFHDGALAMVKPFTQFAAYPNPFRGSVSIRFMLPEEAARLECRLFDARGRTVWEHVRHDGVRTGMNRLVWDGRSAQRGAVSTGMYLLHISAYDAEGRRLATKEQRLVHVR